jgi:putative membrane protein
VVVAAADSGAAAAVDSEAAAPREIGEMALFDQAARTRIEAAIADVEERTAGEIVVVSVTRSDDYHDVRLAYATAWALAGAAIVHAFFPEFAIAWLLWLQAGLVALVWFALGWPALLRPLIPHARAQGSVGRRTRLEFLERRMFETRDRTGILILVSELERRVFMLGDAGIYTQLKADGFQVYVDRIIAAIRGGRAADGVCEVVTDVGRVLAEKFPVRPDDRNELPNAVAQE